MDAKYSVGDWMKDNTIGGSESFWRIIKVHHCNTDFHYSYDIVFISPSNKGDFGKFDILGSRLYIQEARLSPVTNPKDILLCRAMELQEEYQDTLKKSGKLKMDLEALFSARELL